MGRYDVFYKQMCEISYSLERFLAVMQLRVLLKRTKVLVDSGRLLASRRLIPTHCAPLP